MLIDESLVKSKDRHRPGYMRPTPQIRHGDRHLNKFEKAHIIAFDGEGRMTGRMIDESTQEQLYIFFANSEGKEIYDYDGLTSAKCIKLLLDSAKSNPKAINVVFGGTYDFNMILRDMPREKVEELAKSTVDKFVWWGDLLIKYVPRKFMQISKVRDIHNMYILNKKGEYILNIEVSITLWDVIGFFQSSFLVALDKWMPKNYPLTKIITKGKAMREEFDKKNSNFMKKYTRAELSALVDMMKMLLNNVAKIGLTLTRYDGAGAIASSMMKKHKVKEAFCDLPDDVLSAASYAYFGGRVELGKFGTYLAKTHSYDICSAYPSIQWELPDLVHGYWKKRDKKELRKGIHKLHKLTVIHVKWQSPGLLFNAFPYRSAAQNMILFPDSGEGWYWLPEIQAAAEVLKDKPNCKLQLLEAWEFVQTEGSYLPYKFFKDYYEFRKELIKSGDGAEKPIKLGLNSGYGKTAQSAGYNPETKRKPPYHNLAYAGYITSATRARIYRAVMEKPESIIYIATDGICSIDRLDLPITKEKELGLWEYEQHDGIVNIQAGFYYYLKDGKWEGWSRGFDKVGKDKNYQEEMKRQINYIKDCWIKRTDHVYFPCTRFITLKSGVISDSFWPRWCGWYKLGEGKGRSLKLEPVATKRITRNYRGGADKGLIQTYPETNFSNGMSEKYQLPWDYEATHGVKEIDGVPIKIIEEECEYGNE